MSRVQELYEALTFVEEGEPVEVPPVSLAHIVAYLTNGKPLSHAQQRYLFTSPRLRADFQRLKWDLAPKNAAAAAAAAAATPIVRFPLSAAAASAGEREEIEDREFDGFTVQSERSGDVMLISITLHDSSNPPNRLQVEGPQGEVSRITLPPPDGNAPITLIMRLGDESDALFASRLRNRKFSVVLFRAHGFAGGSEEIHTERGKPVSIALMLDDPNTAPKALVLEDPDGGLERIDLPPPRDGKIKFTVDLTDERRRRLLDPGTQGTFLG